MESITKLRRQLRERRRQLSPAQRETAAYQLAEFVAATRYFIHSQHIAFYLPNDGEMDLWPLIHRAWLNHKTCYLPTLDKRYGPRILFMPFTIEDPLIVNRYGIPEPLIDPKRRCRKNWTLDLVLTPLVAFDNQGHRLGMGAGYYDRTFAYLQTRQHWRKPHLMGAAYAMQQVTTLKPRPWDIPLQSIATEKGVSLVKGKLNRIQ